MRFLVITNAPILTDEEGNYIAYSPYVQEMNLWFKYVDEVTIICPTKFNNKLQTLPFERQDIVVKSIPQISTKKFISHILNIVSIIFKLFKYMAKADHIHLRCPGNVGLLGCFVQILFPKKIKTVKYAGNWDPKSKQPWSYRLQKWILSNTFLTRNTKVLVYGNWPKQTKNIVPFFTASYSEKEIEEVEIRSLKEITKGIRKSKISLRQAQTDNTECHPEPVEGTFTSSDDEMLNQVQHDESSGHPEPVEGSKNTKVKFLFVGGLTSGKQPLLTVEVIELLQKKEYNVQLDIYGVGVERAKIANYIVENSLEDVVFLHGNQPKEVVKKAFKDSHFLVFISKSEGWPKVVAEAMFWGCLPITSNVSCVSDMLGNETRGALVKPDVFEIVLAIEKYIKDEKKYIKHSQNALNWSRGYTLEKFEKEIEKLL